MDHIIIIVAYFLIYFNISGLATTNILRLTSGNKLPILASKCRCDNCGTPITPFFQLPIVSYIVCKGKCGNCKIKLPIGALLLEIAILIGMFAISVIFSFSGLGVTLSFLYYEIVRVIVVVKRGRRQEAFVKQYVIAVISMIPFYLLTLFVSLIYSVVCK